MDQPFTGSDGKLRPVVCHQDFLITSAGVWFGDKPLTFALPLLLAQISIIFVTCHACHFFLKYLRQPKAISYILAGLILGKSASGRSGSFTEMLFPTRSWMQLDMLDHMGLLLFLFIIGVKTDLGMIRKSGRKAVAIGLGSVVFPFALMLSVGYLARRALPASIAANEVLVNLAANWGRTSYVVLSCLLAELNLLNSKLGRLAMSATLISDLASTVIISVHTAIMLLLTARNRLLGVGSFLSFLAFLAFIFFIARPLTLWIIRRTPEEGPMEETHFLLVISIAYLCGLIGEFIGHHATMGVFVLALALPGGPPLGSTLENKIEGFVSGVLMPAFLASAGFRSNFWALAQFKQVGMLLLLLLLGAFGKVLAVVLPCLYCKMPVHDIAILCMMLITKGVFEVWIFNGWLDAAVVEEDVYSAIILCVLVLTCISTPVIATMYKPSAAYVAYKRRTVQHAKRDAELRILACVHNQQNVAAVVDLLKIIHPTAQDPFCLYVLHLVQLAGQAAAVLLPYRKQTGRSTATHFTETDYIMNAFRFFEQESRGTVVLQPFVAISPPATMHDDVCTLSMDKKTSIVIVPFHKHRAVDGTMEATGVIKSMNANVFNYAPCSVGLLVDHGTLGSAAAPTANLRHQVLVYFFGGPDDREALACAVRMAENPAAGLTVVRFCLPREWRVPTPEDALDDEMVGDFLVRMVDDKRVVFREEVVRDSEGTVGVIRSMSHFFSLLVVGRRKGGDASPMTDGLSMWSEHPELGVVGDVLASTGFGGNVSTLVVQQQTRVGSDGAGAGPFICSTSSLRSRFSWSRRILPMQVGAGGAPRN